MNIIKKIEQELANSKNTLDSILAPIQDAVFVTNECGITEIWNDVAQSISGYSSDEVIGKKIYEVVVSLEERAPIREAYQCFQMAEVSSSIRKSGTYMATRKNGEKFPIEFSLLALVVDRKKKVVGIVRNVTQQKKIEDETTKPKPQLLDLDRIFVPDKKEAKSLSKKCLVVEDEFLIRKVLLMYLEEIGIYGVGVQSGAVALEKMKLEHFDYVVTDLFMPEMSGDVLIERACTLPLSKDTVYIVSTGGVLTEVEEDVKKRIETYVHEILKKPFTKNDLSRIIDLAQQKKNNNKNR